MKITEIINKDFNKIKRKPVKERMDIYIPNVPKYLSSRNGMCYVMCGAGGSGKTSLLLNLFQKKDLYRCKFDNIFYFCPDSSYSSVKDHPFKNHDKVFHELNESILQSIYDELTEIKTNQEEIEYSVIIIDDFASSLKDKNMVNILNKFIVKLRHLGCGFIFTLQSYLYFPKILRKQITYATIFKPNSLPEWYSIADELFNIKKNDALEIYNYIYDEKYNHLDIDTKENKYYKNFNLLEFKN